MRLFTVVRMGWLKQWEGGLDCKHLQVEVVVLAGEGSYREKQEAQGHVEMALLEKTGGKQQRNEDTSREQVSGSLVQGQAT